MMPYEDHAEMQICEQYRRNLEEPSVYGDFLMWMKWTLYRGQFTGYGSPSEVYETHVRRAAILSDVFGPSLRVVQALQRKQSSS